jgi:hypothetical protein
MSIGDLSTSQGAANQFGMGVIDILDPYQTKNKTVRALTGFLSSDTAGYSGTQIKLNSGVFLNTASITSLTLDQAFGSNFQSGTRFSLYGIKG